MAQITIAYSGVPFSSTPGAAFSATESSPMRLLALPALGQAGFDFSAVPAGYGVHLAGVKVAGTWNGPNAGGFGQGANNNSVLHVAYGSSFTYFQLPNTFSNTVFDTVAVFGPFSYTPGQQIGPLNSDVQCPGKSVVIGVGGNLSGSGLSFTFSALELTFDLIPSGCGSSVPIYSFGCSLGAFDLGGNALVTVTLKDGNGMPVAAPSGGQAFALSTSLGTLAANNLTIAAGSSSATTTLHLSAPGTATVTIVAGAGPCLGQANCVCTSTFVVTSPPAMSMLQPNSCVVSLTRPYFRSAIRRKLGLPTAEDMGFGAVGDEPPGLRYPSNNDINQALDNAIGQINRTSGFHASTNVTIPVPATTSAGPQQFSLTGYVASASQSVINDVRRVVWDDGGGAPVKLAPTSFYALDRANTPFDQYAPSVPHSYYVEGYSLFLTPGAARSGTLRMYCGTGVSTFCSDTDTLDELPNDYIQVVENIACLLLRMARPDEPNAKEQISYFTGLAKSGLAEVRLWAMTINGTQQAGLVYQSGRRRSRR